MGHYKSLGRCPRKEAQLALLRTTGRPSEEVLGPGSYSHGFSLLRPQGFLSTLRCSTVLFLYSSAGLWLKMDAPSLESALSSLSAGPLTTVSSLDSWWRLSDWLLSSQALGPFGSGDHSGSISCSYLEETVAKGLCECVCVCVCEKKRETRRQPGEPKWEPQVAKHSKTCLLIISSMSPWNGGFCAPPL